MLWRLRNVVMAEAMKAAGIDLVNIDGDEKKGRLTSALDQQDGW
jgi:hypothetical protein